MVKINAMKIPGKWRQGYVLDYHTLRSEFLGYDEYGNPMFDTQRSEIGELLYRLKYRSDKTTVGQLVEVATNFVTSWRAELDAILPVPPSKHRAYQPVLEIAKGLSTSLGVPLRNDCILKLKDTPELKNVYNYDERLNLLEDAFTVSDESLKGENILLFDDLYRSGATLNAITNILYSKSSVANVYALALTKTRSIS